MREGRDEKENREKRKNEKKCEGKREIGKGGERIRR